MRQRPTIEIVQKPNSTPQEPNETNLANNCGMKKLYLDDVDQEY
jgi:hypothetical protein